MTLSLSRMKNSVGSMAAALGLLTAHCASAQVVALQLNGRVLDRFGGDDWTNNASSGIGAPAVVEINYSTGLSPSPSGPGSPIAEYVATGSASGWRLRFASLDVTADLERVVVGDTQLWFEAFLPDTLTTLSVELRFMSDISAQLSLPTGPLPPLVARAPQGGISGYVSTVYFDTSGLQGYDSGSLVLGIDSVSVMPTATPIPEPSAYGFGAFAVIATVLIFRRSCGSNKAA
jgi:hypothetical protein